MAISKEELGKLVLDYYENLDLAAELGALLAQTSENMTALGTRLKSRPESITADQAKISFKDDSQNERTIPLAALDIGHICLALRELQQATALNNQIKTDLIEAGLSRLAHEMGSSGPPTPDILR